MPTSSKSFKQPTSLSNEMQITEILDPLSKGELKKLILTACMDWPELKGMLLSGYTKKTTDDSEADYPNRIQTLIERRKGFDGIISYNNAKELAGELQKLLEEAKQCVKNQDYRTATIILTTLIEEVDNTLGISDDDGEFLINCIDNTIGVFETLCEQEIEESLRKEITDFLLFAYENDYLIGWEWHINLMNLAVRMYKTQEEKEKILSILEPVDPDHDEWGWEYDELQALLLEVILKEEGEEGVGRYLIKNSSKPEIRSVLIKQAIENKDYENARTLINEGIKALGKKKKYAERVEEWRNDLLSIYLEMGDTQNAIRTAHYFLVHEQEDKLLLENYYLILKKLIPTDEWGQFIQEIIDKVSKKGSRIPYSHKAQLYILEKRWDDLLVLLQGNCNLSRIVQAEEYLARLYPEMLATLYRESILSFVNNSSGKTYHQFTYQYILKMAGLNVNDQVRELISRLRELYPKRKALMVELDRAQKVLKLD